MQLIIPQIRVPTRPRSTNISVDIALIDPGRDIQRCSDIEVNRWIGVHIVELLSILSSLRRIEI